MANCTRLRGTSIAVLVAGWTMLPPIGAAAPSPTPSATVFAFRGSIHDAARHPLAGVLVEVLSNGQLSVEATTDAGGDFETPPLPPGTYVLRASLLDYRRSTISAELGPATSAIDLALTELTPGLSVVIGGDRQPPPPTSGASVAVVTRAMIQSLPGGDDQPLSSVIATQPGFVADTFGFGLHARGADGGVLWVIDGVPLLASPLTQWGAAGGFIPTRLVQNLEITTGGFPAEYTVGIGAVINVTTREALGPPAGEVQVSYGTYNTTHVALNYSQQIGKVSFFFGGDFEVTDRGLDAPAASPILHDHALTGSGFGRLQYALEGGDRLELITSYTQASYQIPIDPTVLPLSDAPPGAVRGVDQYGNPPPPFVPYNANPTDTERDFFAALAWTHHAGTATMQLTPYARESYGDLLCDPAGALGPTADPGSTCSDVRRDLWHGGVAASLRWKLGTQQDWKAGATLDYAHGDLSYASYTRDDASPAGGADPSKTLTRHDVLNTTQAGVYVQDRITSGKWTIFPGARLDLESASFVAGDEPPLFLVGPSARLAASYAATENLVVHGSAGYLWAPPNSFDGPVAARILIPALADQPVPFDIKAEKDLEAEIGITSRLFRILSVGLTAYARYSWDVLDRQTVGNTNVLVSYNFAQGRAVGVELPVDLRLSHYLTAFANASWQIAQGEGIDSERYLFTTAQLANTAWATLDHAQTWTVNAGFDVHDKAGDNHLAASFNYGSGLRTGPLDNETVPAHAVFNMSLRHRFDVLLHPEVAFDAFNLFNEVYAYRIATGNVGSAYAPLRTVDVRLIVNFPR